ncbi:cytohesin-1-like [Dysidea avara]|uniref:cytohesin-1-like n=1 Tax=Dysidea avara TaxID=196820 RepID=UPI003317B439
MTEVLPLPTGLFGKSSSTEELNTLHAWPSVTPSMSVSSITAAEQRDLQQISQFRERIEKEIEELKSQIRKMGEDSNRQQEYEQLIQHAEKEIPTKELWRTGRMRFSKHPSEGIKYLIEHGLLNKTAEDVAVFLFEGAEILNKVAIGEYLGSVKDFNQSVLKCFVQLHQFKSMDLVNALRLFLKSFVLPGESQQIDRMIETFATRYCSCNPHIFSCTDTCYVLSFSIIMLNTGLHNPNVKDKPSVEKFIMMNKGLDNGQDLPHELLTNYYDSIKKDPLPRPEDGSDLAETFFSPDHQGWLVKEGGKHKNWKKRWFILTDNCLYYFKSPQDKGPKGIIPLENLQIRDGNDAKKPFMFEIFQDLMGSALGTIKACKVKDANNAVVTGNHEVYRIQANNENEKTVWMKKIKASIHRDPFFEMLQQRRQAVSQSSKSSQTVVL